LEGEKITDPNQEFTTPAELEGKVLQLGKKTFRRLTA
jgi:tyrosyl-tRNA synthetase